MSSAQSLHRAVQIELRILFPPSSISFVYLCAITTLYCGSSRLRSSIACHWLNSFQNIFEKRNCFEELPVWHLNHIITQVGQERDWCISVHEPIVMQCTASIRCEEWMQMVFGQAFRSLRWQNATKNTRFGLIVQFTVRMTGYRFFRVHLFECIFLLEFLLRWFSLLVKTQYYLHSNKNYS